MGIWAVPLEKCFKSCLSQMQFWAYFDANVTYFLCNECHSHSSQHIVLTVSEMVKYITLLICYCDFSVHLPLEDQLIFWRVELPFK